MIMTPEFSLKVLQWFVLWQLQIPHALYPSSHLAHTSVSFCFNLLPLHICSPLTSSSAAPIWTQVWEQHISLSILGVCTWLFLPTLPFSPLRMMSSVLTISASSCTALPCKHVYPSTYSSLPPYGTAASPDFLSRKLELDMLWTQLLSFFSNTFCR